LKDNGTWAPLIQHWKIARAGLRKLARMAQAPGSLHVVLRRYDELQHVSSHGPDGIVGLDIAEVDAVGSDPTGRDVLERQLSGDSLDRAQQNAGRLDDDCKAKRTDDGVIVLHPFAHAQLTLSTPEPQAMSGVRE
jgi:hypothetical protein